MVRYSGPFCTIYEDIFQWSFLCFQFQLSDISSQVFRNLQTGERILDGEIFFQNFLDRTADFYQHFLWFSYISSLSSQLSASNSVIFLCNTTLVDGVSSYVVSLPVAVPPSPIAINIFPKFEIRHDLVLFRVVSRMFFFSFFSNHSQKGSPTLCMKNNCCMYA